MPIPVMELFIRVTVTDVRMGDPWPSGTERARREGALL